MDGFYCVPQTLGLVRGEPKEGAKNRANGEAIMREAMYERASRSPTLDRSRSGKNDYWGKVGVKSLGGDHWEWTKARADEWRSTYTDKHGKERSRRLPRQSVIAIATIVKAPAEVTAGWSEEKREKFFADAADALQECDPVFYNPANTIYRAVHRDEADGCHVHFAHEARDKDGRYCGSRYDAKWRQGLAAAFAKKMREKGWSVLNPKLTDWERYRSVRKARPGERGFLLDRARCGLEAGTRVAWADPDYRREVDERRRRQGLSVEEHHARMEQAKELEAAKAEQAAAEKARDDAKAVTAQAVQAKTDADAALGEAQEAVKKAQDAQDEAERKAGEAQEAAEKAKSNLEKLEGDATFIDPETNEKRVGIKGAKRELADLAKRRQQLVNGWDKDGEHHPGVEELTETNAQLTEDNKQLTETNAQLTAENEELAGRLARLNELMEAATKRFNELTQRIFDRIMDAWYKRGPWAEEKDPVEVNAAIKDEFDEMER